MKNLFWVVLVLSSCIFSDSFAEEVKPPTWENNAETSLLRTSGNTDVTTLGLGISSVYRPDPWAVKAKANYLTSSTTGTKTAENYDALFRGERKIVEDLSGFLDGTYLKNEFTGFKDRMGADAGVNYVFLASDAHTLSTDFSLGVLKENLITGVGGASLGSRTFATGKVGLEYKWKISPSAELTDTLSLLDNFSASSDWRLSNTMALTTMVSQLLSLKVSFRVDHLNVPITGKKPTDTSTNITLVAKF